MHVQSCSNHATCHRFCHRTSFAKNHSTESRTRSKTIHGTSSIWNSLSKDERSSRDVKMRSFNWKRTLLPTFRTKKKSCSDDIQKKIRKTKSIVRQSRAKSNKKKRRSNVSNAKNYVDQKKRIVEEGLWM